MLVRQLNQALSARVTMKHFTILLTSLFLSGCSSIVAGLNCLDASIERKPTLQDGYYLVGFQLNDNYADTFTVQCENYYNAQCSARGNYWSWRNIENDRGYNYQHTYKINGNDIGINSPYCLSLINKKTNVNSFNITHNNQRVWVRKIGTDTYQYNTKSHSNQKSELVDIHLKWNITYIPNAQTHTTKGQ